MSKKRKSKKQFHFLSQKKKRRNGNRRKILRLNSIQLSSKCKSVSQQVFLVSIGTPQFNGIVKSNKKLKKVLEKIESAVKLRFANGQGDEEALHKNSIRRISLR